VADPEEEPAATRSLDHVDCTADQCRSDLLRALPLGGVDDELDAPRCVMPAHLREPHGRCSGRVTSDHRGQALRPGLHEIDPLALTQRPATVRGRGPVEQSGHRRQMVTVQLGPDLDMHAPSVG
jgi:hypothetical protein